MKLAFVYILASAKNGTLYIGVTSNLQKRIYEHKNHLLKDSFTDKYNVTKLVYFEQFDEMYAAIQREKNLKHYIRKWKLDLIENKNPDWRDLYEEII